LAKQHLPSALLIHRELFFSGSRLRLDFVAARINKVKGRQRERRRAAPYAWRRALGPLHPGRADAFARQNQKVDALRGGGTWIKSSRLFIRI
jgi:hypothetical protein